MIPTLICVVLALEYPLQVNDAFLYMLPTLKYMLKYTLAMPPLATHINALVHTIATLTWSSSNTYMHSKRGVPLVVNCSNPSHLWTSSCH